MEDTRRAVDSQQPGSHRRLMHLRPLIAAALLLRSAALSAQQPLPLMPPPAHLELAEGPLALDSGFSVAVPRFANDRLRRGVDRALTRLADRIGQPIARTLRRSGGATLPVRVAAAGEAIQSPEEDESYRLDVSDTGAVLAAPTVVGALRGLETLQQ